MTFFLLFELGTTFIKVEIIHLEKKNVHNFIMTVPE